MCNETDTHDHKHPESVKSDLPKNGTAYYSPVNWLLIIEDEDKKLLKEVGKNGEGEADEVQQLIDEVRF